VNDYEPVVECRRMNARLTKRSCGLNQFSKRLECFECDAPGKAPAITEHAPRHRELYRPIKEPGAKAERKRKERSPLVKREQPAPPSPPPPPRKSQVFKRKLKPCKNCGYLHRRNAPLCKPCDRVKRSPGLLAEVAVMRKEGLIKRGRPIKEIAERRSALYAKG
jgi:hypothetical protein